MRPGRRRAAGGGACRSPRAARRQHAGRGGGDRGLQPHRPRHRGARHRLAEQAGHVPAAQARGRFRLAVDRSFTLDGIGTVVTGTAFAGSVAPGDRLLVSPGGLEVRVRGLQAQHHAAARGAGGERLALNLAGSGLDRHAVRRGDWLVAAAAHAPTSRMDVRLRVLPAEKSLPHWTAVRLHLATCEVGARIVPLEGPQLDSGASGWAQLELERPIGALRGDRFIVRDQSAQRTLGGGVVVDAFASARQRRSPQRLGMLAALEAPTAQAAFAALLGREPADGIDVQRFATLCNLDAGESAGIERDVAHRLLADGGLRLAFACGQLERIASRITDVLAGHHRRAPDSPGLTADPLRRALALKPPLAVFTLLLRDLVDSGAVRRSGPYLRLAGHEPALLPAEQALWERIRPWIDEGGLHPPKLGDLLLRDRALHRDPLLRLMAKLSRMGRLYLVGNDYFVLPRQMAALAAQAQALAAADPHGRLNVKALREASGISRHLSVPLVEFFDHVGFTRRDEIGRKIRRDALGMFDGPIPQGRG